MHRPRATGDALQRILAAIPPASGAVVMGTGIVSIALSLDGHETSSRVLLVLDAVIWVALAVLLPARATRDRARFLVDVRTPAALTSVAGTAVLGTRLTLLGWDWAGVALLAIALVLWAALLAPVLTHWTTPTVGVSLVLTVSTESLAVLAATLATHEHTRWLLDAGLASFLLGLAFYAFVIRSFEIRQIAVGRGDHWITGGALAISTLAAGRITLAAKGLHTLSASPRRSRWSRSRCGRSRSPGCPFCCQPRRCVRACAMTCGAGRRCSPSGCTPLAASSSAPLRTRRGSPTSRASGCGQASRYGSPCSWRCSAAGGSWFVAKTPPSAHGATSSSRATNAAQRARHSPARRLPPHVRLSHGAFPHGSGKRLMISTSRHR